jgi:uncharacterized protein
LKNFRKKCRWIHREFGFLAVGLTLIYAVSGIAINHRHHWNPAAVDVQIDNEIQMINPVGTGSTQLLLPAVESQVKTDSKITGYFRQNKEILHLFVGGGKYYEVNLLSGEVVYKITKDRAVFNDLNYMHYNRGHAAWTVIGDVYAGMLIFMALTGIFLARGRRGLKGRGGVLMGLGFVLPLVYIVIERYM